MEIERMFSESFEYTKECLVGKWVKWILLIVCSIIFPLIYGYTVRILRGTTPAPELEDWVGLFIDGIKLLIIGFIYMIPVILVLMLSVGAGTLGYMGKGDFSFIGFGTAIAGLGISAIIALIIGLIAVIGGVRFARTGSMGEAFNFRVILDTIEGIGWGNYILALIVLYIVLFIVSFVIAMITAIPIIGWIINIFMAPAISVFQARYICLIYDSSELSA